MSKRPELYLTLELGSERAEAATAALETALQAAEIASVLIRPADGKSLDAGTVKALVGLAQKRGVAALIADDANLARMLKADGVHIAWSKDPLAAFAEARAHLGDHAMIGADAGRSRDDAMALGEAGADYIAFGIPAHVEDRTTAEERQCDLINWWSEIFEIPCVAFDVATAGQASALASNGSDFITVAISSAMTAAEITGVVSEFAFAITPAEASA